MHIVAIAWGFVVILMAAAEATAPNGSVLGALITLLLYGVLPLPILLYILNTPQRRRRRAAQEAAEAAQATSATPDAGRQSASHSVTPE